MAAKKDTVTFELAPEYRDGFDGGSVALADGSVYDVHGALTAGKGSITLDETKDAGTIAALDGFVAVRRAKGGN